MNDSLSIVVPVRNAERTLPKQVAALLDVLPDLTSRFELILIDDGSTDQTVDLARELARRFPQVRLVRHSKPLGAAAAVRTGMARAAGKRVYVQEAHAWPTPGEVRRFWANRHERQASDQDSIDAARIDEPHPAAAVPRGLTFLKHLKRLALEQAN